MPDVVQLIILMLAVARLSGLTTIDEITKHLRDRILSNLDDRPSTLGSHLTYVLTCPWCVSMYIAAPWVAATHTWPDTPWLWIPAEILAISQATGMMSKTGRS